LATWNWATPSLAAFKALAPWTIAAVLARNVALCLIVYGLWHTPLYARQSQGTEFKYNGRWLEQNSGSFLFRDQLKDNLFWTLVSGVPLRTAWEIATLWGQANGYAPTIGFADHPVWFVALFVLIPVYCEARFYLVHRLIAGRRSIATCISCTITT
jgi:sterol desaturase/sphingolipid hydroxylase (fatty acid hydroxylase superfamily)